MHRVAGVLHETFRVRARGVPAAATSPSGVTVQVEGALGEVRTLGDAAALLRSHRLSAADSAAVANALRAVQLLRSLAAQQGAVDQARLGVTLLLHVKEADSGGPYAEPGRISVGSHNPTRKTGGPVLPLDVALHELMHVAQMRVVGANGDLNSELAEGISDAFAMLVTDDWRLGEEYGTVIRDGRSTPGRADERYVSDYRTVRGGRIEPHSAGGVVVRTMSELAARVGRDDALFLLMAVVNDRGAWRGGGTWPRFARALVDAAARTWPDDATRQQALAVALGSTHLDEALLR